MDISEIQDKDFFEEYLYSLSVKEIYEIAPILAYRCALRVAVVGNNNFRLLIFRATIIACICHKKPAPYATYTYAHDTVRLANALVHTIHADHAADVIAVVADAINVAADNYAINNDLKDVAAGNYDTNDDLINVSDNNDDPLYIQLLSDAYLTSHMKFWLWIQQDIISYQQSRDIGSIHLWHSDNNIPDTVKQELEEWKEYHSNNPSEHWDIWITYYQYAIEGKDFFDDKVLKELITWDNQRWQREPAIVNKEIKDLVIKNDFDTIKEKLKESPLSHLNTEEELKSRENIIQSINDFVINKESNGLIGHNNPPPDEENTNDEKQTLDILVGIRNILQQQDLKKQEINKIVEHSEELASKLLNLQAKQKLSDIFIDKESFRKQNAINLSNLLFKYIPIGLFSGGGLYLIFEYIILWLQILF